MNSSGMSTASMSGRTEKSSLEQALKEVFYIHRNTVKEYQSEIGQWIERYEELEKEKSKLKEEVENLEKRNVKLIEERALLNQNVDQTKRRSDEGCTMCEHLKQSIKAIQDAYKQTLEEKDNMIQFLKEQLTEKSGNRPLSDLSNHSQSRSSTSKTPDNTNIVDTKRGGSLKKKHSPDSTVDANKTRTERSNVTKKSEDTSNDQKNEKLRLSRKSKRVKYKEDISPTNKKLKYSPNADRKEGSGSSSENTSPFKPGSLNEETQSKKKMASQSSTSSSSSSGLRKSEFSRKQGSSKKTSTESKSNNDKFFVPETCLDQTVAMSTDEDLADGDDHRTRNLVVPETLGMEAYSSCSEEFEDDLDLDTMVANTQKQQTNNKNHSLLNKTGEKSRTSLPRSRSIMNDTTHILNSPNSETSDVEVDANRPHPKLDVSLTKSGEEKIDPDETSESGYASRIEKSYQKIESGSEGDFLPQNNAKQNQESQNSIPKKKQREGRQCKQANTGDLSVNVECDGDDTAFPLSPVFTKPVSKNGASNVKQVIDQISAKDKCFEDPGSPLLLQSGKSYKYKDKKESISTARSQRNVQNLTDKKSASLHLPKQPMVKKSSQESNRSTRVKKKMAKNSGTDSADDTMKQTTLSQVFTSSPILSAPPVQSESEKKKIEEAIRRSLLDFQKEAKQRSEQENVFKIPLSPKSTTPHKRRPSSSKKSPATTPEKCADLMNPDETVAPSPEAYASQPLIPLRRSPRKSPMKNAINARTFLTTEQPIDDLDETVAPSPNILMGGKSLSDDDDTSQVLNRSIAPDVHLTQYCQDSEVDPLKASPTLKKENKNARKKIDLSLNEESQSLPCSSKSFKFGGRKKRAQSIETQQEDILEEDEDGGTLKDEEEIMEDEKLDEDNHTSFDSSFDRVEKKKARDYAHVKVVKKQDERRKLKGHSCKECYEYYKSTGMSEAEIQSRIQDCSRHRAEYIPPDTPEHYWSIGFPDTQECHERGYAQIERNTKPSNFRRKRQLQKQFKSKAENNEEDHEDLIFK